ncbi:MAG: hypothetical protein KAT77_01570 [Nanoarchaeota archaeon]|nr:hypothetical protein [Nanoarchaeota archaeon]
MEEENLEKELISSLVKGFGITMIGLAAYTVFYVALVGSPFVEKKEQPVDHVKSQIEFVQALKEHYSTNDPRGPADISGYKVSPERNMFWRNQNQ